MYLKENMQVLQIQLIYLHMLNIYILPLQINQQQLAGMGNLEVMQLLKVWLVVMVISSLDDLLSPSSVHKTYWLVLG